MGPVAITTFLCLASIFLSRATAFRFAANDEEVTEPLPIRSSKTAHHYSQLYQSKEWVAAPNGYLYQFHAGDQSWLGAREFCLSQNSELVILRDKEQIDWLLNHYAPMYPRFAERYIQIGLTIPDGPSRDWMYLDGSKYNQSVISWMSGEPFDHSADGLERCALLRVHARVLDDVDCEASPRNQMPVRFICERSSDRHKQQQLAKNFIWGKLEELLGYFGFGNNNSTVPSKNNVTINQDGEDYIDEVSKLNVTSSEREILKKIKVFETSSEEEQEVLDALRNLNKPGSTDSTPTSTDGQVTTPNALQEVRSQTSTEIATKESTTEQLLTTTNREVETTPAETSSAVAATSGLADLTEEESKTDAPATTEIRETTEEDTTELPTTDEKASGSSSTKGATSESPEVEETKPEEPATAVSTTEVPPLEEVTHAGAARAHAVPLREIDEEEGSGVNVEKSQIEKDSKNRREIDPEKLEKIIHTMEKMVANLENISILEKQRENKKELAGNTIHEEKKTTKEDPQKKETKKKEKSNDALVSITAKNKEDGAGQADMERDFDEKLSKSMPTTDIKPPVEEDCEEEASGDQTTTMLPPDDALRNAVDTEDVEDLSQKPKIPVEREEHIQDFLRTLRTFLMRAEHSDLRKLLDNNPGKTLLEKMKLAIAAANAREFARMKELELLKKHGVDISNVPEPKLIGDTEREDLFKKISGVVMEEAEKHGLENATEPSARTTTQETLRSTTESEKSREGNKRVPKGRAHDESSTKDVDKPSDFETTKAASTEETTAKNSDKSAENQVEETKKPEMEGSANTDEPVAEESTTHSKTSAEMPMRTVQLKEFDNKEVIMSIEARTGSEERDLIEKKADKKSSEKEAKGEEDDGIVKTEPIKEEHENAVEEGSEEDGTSTTTTTSATSMTSDISSKTRSSSHAENESEEKSAEDNSFDSNEVDRSSDSHESVQVSTTQIPPELDENHEEEVGTEKTPAAKRAERARLAKAKKAHREMAKESKKVENSSDEDEKRDGTNPLGLPTLPPPPTLAPLPNLENVIENIQKQWKKLFTPPKLRL